MLIDALSKRSKQRTYRLQLEVSRQAIVLLNVAKRARVLVYRLQLQFAHGVDAKAVAAFRIQAMMLM